MNYVSFERLRQETKDFPDAHIFVTYRSDDSWAFGMRINGTYTFTRFLDKRVDLDGIRKAKKQILFCKNYGWSYMGRKAWNTEVDEHENEFMCLYCRSISFDISKPCACRNKTTESMLKKTKSGIILPF